MSPSLPQSRQGTILSSTYFLCLRDIESFQRRLLRIQIIKLVFFLHINNNVYLKTISMSYLCIQIINFIGKNFIICKDICSGILTITLMAIAKV